MTCRHSPGDTSCSSHPQNQIYVSDRAREYKKYIDSKTDNAKKSVNPETPDSSNYEIVDVLQVEEHLILKVQYPNCSKCAYEGNKVLVYLNQGPLQAMKWRKIDPHFRSSKELKVIPNREAPSPSARFPASEEGWADAVAYAKSKVSSVL